LCWPRRRLTSPRQGWGYGILDGKLVDTDRCRTTTTSRHREQINA